jgi:hypothetical protein
MWARQRALHPNRKVDDKVCEPTNRSASGNAARASSALAAFDPGFEMNLKPLSFWAERFSPERFKACGRIDHFSWCARNAPPDQSAKQGK